MKKMIISLVFASWWLMNIFLNFPNTSIIAVENNNIYTGIKNTLFQNWNFFAPPPKSDIRLYYVYKDKNGKKIIYEFFKDLCSTSREHFPFNDSQLDLIFYLHNLSRSLLNQIRIDYQNYVVEKKIDNETNFSYNTFVNSKIKEYDKRSQMQALLKHARKVAVQKRINYEYVEILLAEEDIPKYIDRHSNKRRMFKFLYTSQSYKK